MLRDYWWLACWIGAAAVVNIAAGPNSAAVGLFILLSMIALVYLWAVWARWNRRLRRVAWTAQDACDAYGDLLERLVEFTSRAPGRHEQDELLEALQAERRTP